MIVFQFSFKKAKFYKLKICSFGVHKNSDIYLKKIVKGKTKLKFLLTLKIQLLDLEIKDLNIYNVFIISGFSRTKSKYSKN